MNFYCTGLTSTVHSARKDYPYHFEPKDSDVTTENVTNGGAGARKPKKQRRDPSFGGVADMFEDSKISK